MTGRTIKYIKLYEDSPFRKIKKSDKSDISDYKNIQKISNSIRSKSLLSNDSCLCKIIYGFYKHINSCYSTSVNPRYAHSDDSDLFHIGNRTIDLDAIGKLYFINSVYRSYDSYEDCLQSIIDTVKIRVSDNKLSIILPCRIGSYNSQLFILNPNIENNITVKDIYVNEFIYVILNGYKDNKLISYYNRLTNGRINAKMFAELHNLLNDYNITDIDVKYAPISINFDYFTLNLIDIQSLDEAYESFFSIFVNGHAPLSSLTYIRLLNSFIQSNDYIELKKIYAWCGLESPYPYEIFSILVSDEKQLKQLNKIGNKNIDGIINIVKIPIGLCKNIRFYNYTNLSDLTHIDVKSSFILQTLNPRKCSIKNDILKSMYLINNALSFELNLDARNAKQPTNYEILKLVYHTYLINANDYKRIDKYDKISNSKNVQMNVDNDEYSNFITKVVLKHSYNNSYDNIAVCDCSLIGS